MLRINTNVNALNACTQANLNQQQLHQSLERLGSGLRINSSKDDASGMSISNNLLSYAHTLKQANNNANDAIGILQIADKAIDEQLKILDIIKAKSTQAAQDGQTSKTRAMLLSDINHLLEEFDAISNNTNYNGMSLLNGNFINKKFQIGFASNQVIQSSILSTNSKKIGNTRFETSANIIAGNYGNIDVKINSMLDGKEYTISNIEIGSETNQGIGNLANEINKISDKTGVRAYYNVITKGTNTIKSGNTGDDFSINGVNIGRLEIKNGDSNGALIQAINSIKNETGVEASVDAFGYLNLKSLDGRGITIKDSSNGIFGIASLRSVQGVVSEVEKFKATSDGGIVINGEAVEGATNITDFIKNVNKITNKTQVMAKIENGNIIFVPLGEGKSLQISGNEVRTKLGIPLTTVRGDWVDSSKAFIKRPADEDNPPSLALYVLYDGEDKPRYTPNIKLEGKADGIYTLYDVAECFNRMSAQTGIKAFVEENEQGQVRLCFDMPDNVSTIKGISTGSKPEGSSGDAYSLGFGGDKERTADGAKMTTICENYGRLSLVGSSSSDISISVNKDGLEQNGLLGMSTDLKGFYQTNVSLKEMTGALSLEQEHAMGFYDSIFDSILMEGKGLSLKKAMALMDVSENAIKDLNKIRSDIGSVQNQLQATINNISLTEISLLNSASNVKDLDFANESIKYTKLFIITQSNINALYKANILKSQIFFNLFKF
ncbi:flagellin hook IN motif-containing protein [Campylobacter jejuni]|uniref:flagellin N-terminal helical domain-containing protein n=1 Tax=Campylobacter jejuni TaxID=197 RepID=UPI000F80E015|nr:flagellin hook IN motif-containing protein [Campylobacter jejuni]RTJ14579.1 hypothetical protein C3H85_06935 [Campylobacter jejuni]RTJ55333.1 hypothetical protein C3H64_07265 [Campylobacter jejuni]RTJ99444.1 hypothetical protein C3H36_07190 [Campylobacter jejuni]HEF3809540.1 hypothetical protein [Campylobacter jejuni]